MTEQSPEKLDSTRAALTRSLDISTPFNRQVLEASFRMLLYNLSYLT